MESSVVLLKQFATLRVTSRDQISDLRWDLLTAFETSIFVVQDAEGGQKRSLEK